MLICSDCLKKKYTNEDQERKVNGPCSECSRLLPCNEIDRYRLELQSSS